MNKEQLISLMKENGESVITYRSPESKKLKYNVCTLDLSGYVETKQNRAKEDEDSLLMFCWDVDAYRLMKLDNITSVVPLASVLRRANVR